MVHASEEAEETGQHIRASDAFTHVQKQQPAGLEKRYVYWVCINSYRCAGSKELAVNLQKNGELVNMGER